MDWIEVTDEDGLEIGGEAYPRRYRLRVPYRVALPLVSGSRAQFVPGPHPGRGTAGMPLRPVGDVDFTRVDGIGEETAADIVEWLDEEGIETVKALLERDLEGLPGVGPDLAEALRGLLE